MEDSMAGQIRKRTVAYFLLVVALLMSLTSLYQTAFAFDKVIYANADPFKYSVELDLTNKIVTVYEKGTSGKYNKIAKQFICTIGASKTPTPLGSFRFNESRRRFGYFREFDVYAQYWTNVAGGIFFHSILYTKPKEGYFTRTSFNNLGGTGSHGCIRLLVEDARWLYYNVPAGSSGVILNKEKNEALRKSLLPKVSYKNYKPTADEYEAVKRDYPKAILKADATFSSTSGKNTLVKKGAVVSVISSGKISCRVRVSGQEGHIETKYLDFQPNGPKDTGKTEKAITVFEVTAKQTNLYEKAGEKSAILATYGKGTILKPIAETKSFYQVEVDGKKGFVLKKDVKSIIMTESTKLVVNEVEAVIDISDNDDVPATPKPTVAPKATPKPTAKPTVKPPTATPAVPNDDSGINEENEQDDARPPVRWVDPETGEAYDPNDPTQVH